MRSTIFLLLLAVFAVMGVLSWLRIPFANRFWVRARRFGYLYVALVLVLAALSLIFGRQL